MDFLVIGDGLDHEIRTVADVGAGTEKDRADADGKEIAVERRVANQEGDFDVVNVHRTAGERGGVVGLQRAKRLAEAPALRDLTRDTVRGGGTLRLPADLTVDGNVDYDILNQQLLSTRLRLRWGIQCCAFTVERLTFNYNTRDERQFRFSIELANLGSIGNFLGAEEQMALGLAGYR